MDRLTIEAQANLVSLVGTLDELLRELADASERGEVSWLRPLAVLSAEIEFSSLRNPQLDSTTVADQCRELAELLTGSSGTAAEFVVRYISARRGSRRVADLHERVLSIGRAIVTGDSHPRSAE